MELKIGTVAKMTGLSPSGIRFLEDEGLLSPSGGRKGSYRSYSLSDVSTLLDYRNYRQCGFSQEDILKLIKAEDYPTEAKIFDKRCDELEASILQATRLLHFLRHRARSMDITQHADVFWEITDRPAILWMPVTNDKGKLSDWPKDSGFEIPYADSVLLFRAEEIAGDSASVSASLGIGMYESNVSSSSFHKFDDVQYFGREKSLHCMVEITSDFQIAEESLRRSRAFLAEALQQSKLSVDDSHPAITKRIFTSRRGEKSYRYDHLWITLK